MNPVTPILPQLVIAGAAPSIALLVGLTHSRPWPARVEPLRAVAKMPAIWFLVLRGKPVASTPQRVEGSVTPLRNASLVEAVDHARSAARVRRNAWYHVAFLGLAGFIWWRTRSPTDAAL